MSKDVTINIEQNIISIKEVNQQSYISLTDIARVKSEEPKDAIANWMRLKNTIQLLGYWEIRHNPNFKGQYSGHCLRYTIGRFSQFRKS